VEKAKELLPAFEGEQPVPCHRDYGPANWLVDEDGNWAGVIDMEFSAWDVRIDDFTRYPDWEWIQRPELVEALFEGYGLSLTERERKQYLVSHTLYALGAIVWGHGYGFYGFEQEGRDALRHLAQLLG